MPFHNNLSSLVFVAGLSVTAGASLWYDAVPNFTRTSHALPVGNATLPLKPGRGIDATDIADARVAWAYFANNTRAETGLVDAVAGFPSGTIWDQGSYLLGLVSAHRLGVISDEDFHQRADRFLSAIAALPLYQGLLPNKVYDTRTLTMVDYENTITPEGIGWSALDIARLLSGFRVLEHHHPQYAADIRLILLQWDLGKMTAQGRLMGADHQDGQMVILQEGRLGYEQYGARAAALWGLDVLDAISARSMLEWHQMSGVEVPIDQRRATKYKAVTPILSEPFLLQSLEMGLTQEGRLLAERVYRAQENRFSETGIETMVSEGHIDREPHFLYTSVYSNGRDWAVVSEDGKHHPELRSISLKAVYGWHAMYDTPYTAHLRATLSDLANETGWRSGRYEGDQSTNQVQTANTNAVVLQALHYKAFGPLMQLSK
jgi:hypothetical protein